MKALDKFFFEPRPTEGIALFRILFGLLVLCYLLADLGNIKEFYGPHSIASLATVKGQFQNPHMNVFHLLNQSYTTLYFMIGIYIISTLSMILGFYTRTSIFLVLVCMTSFHQRNIWLLSSLEVLMRTVTIYLLCSPCGHSLSIDSLLGQKFRSFKKDKRWAPWALRLIQIQLSVVYLWTVWHKINGNDWLDGSALYYATRMEDMTNFSLPFIMDSIVVLKMLTWSTLAIEIALGTLVWVEKFRKPVIVTGLIFHLGIEYFMSIPFFEILMMCLLILYFTPEELRDFVYKIQHKLSNFKLQIHQPMGVENESI